MSMPVVLFSDLNEFITYIFDVLHKKSNTSNIASNISETDTKNSGILLLEKNGMGRTMGVYITEESKSCILCLTFLVKNFDGEEGLNAVLECQIKYRNKEECLGAVELVKQYKFKVFYYRVVT